MWSVGKSIEPILCNNLSQVGVYPCKLLWVYTSGSKCLGKIDGEVIIHTMIICCQPVYERILKGKFWCTECTNGLRIVYPLLKCFARVSIIKCFDNISNRIWIQKWVSIRLKLFQSQTQCFQHALINRTCMVNIVWQWTVIRIYTSNSIALLHHHIKVT